MPPPYTKRYFLALDGFPDSEREVTEAEFVKAERAAGFYATSGPPDKPATGGFGNGSVKGRVEYIFPDRKETTT